METNNIIIFPNMESLSMEDIDTQGVKISIDAFNGVTLLSNATAYFNFAFENISDDNKDLFFYVCLHETITKFNLDDKQTEFFIIHAFDWANYILNPTLKQEALGLFKAIKLFDELREGKIDTPFEVACASAMRRADFNNKILFLKFIANREEYEKGSKKK